MGQEIYANAIANYLSGKLLGIEKLRRLSDADFYDAVKMLIEYGYGGGHVDGESYDIDRFITAETRRLCDFVEETCASEYLGRCLLSRFRYSDAKVLFKARYIGSDAESALYLAGDAMKNAFTSGEYGDLFEPMREAAEQLSEKYAEQKPSAKEIDLYFTRAMHKDNLNCAKLSRNKGILEYCRAQIDIANILSAFRAKKLQMDEAALLSELFEGGTVPFEHAVAILNGDHDHYSEFFEHTEYDDIVDALESEGVNAYLKKADELLLGVLRGQLDDITGHGPFIRYFIEQILEFKAIKFILIAIKNNIKFDINSKVWSFEV